MNFISRFINFLFLISVLLPLLSQPAAANVVGTDLQNFNTTTSGIDYVTVESAEILGVGLINFGLFSNYAINSLPIFEDEDENQSRLKPNDTLLTAEMNFGLGLFKDFEIGFSVPYLIEQTFSNDDVGRGQYGATGFTSYRFHSKYRIGEWKEFGFAGVLGANFNLIQNNPYVGQNDATIYNIQLAVDRKILNLSVAANLGFRWRGETKAIESSEIEPTEDQIISSIGTSYLISSIDTKLIAEIFGSRPRGNTSNGNSERQASSAEALLGLKYDMTSELAAHAGWGTELIHGASSPDWRVYAGINWTIGPTFGRSEEVKVEEKADKSEEKVDKIVLQSLHFKFGSSDTLTKGGIDAIKKVANVINSEPYEKIIVEGHTDSVGSESYNLKLSKERADTVRLYLIQNYGIDASKIESTGFGETKPIADNGNFQGRAKNRRVEIRIFRP